MSVASLPASNGSGIRQPPGPKNALGRLKINLTDDDAIYLHDTNAKSAFNRDQRDLSHGCVRVKDIDQLAGELMRDGGDDSRLDEALATSDTRTLPLPRRWNVYLVYFTMDQDETGALRSYSDPYSRDATIIARLGGASRAARAADCGKDDADADRFQLSRASFVELRLPSRS